VSDLGVAGDEAQAYFAQLRTDRLRSYVEMAAMFGVDLAPDEDCPDGYTLLYRPADPTWPLVHLTKMLVNWRLSEFGDLDRPYGRYWCFTGISDLTFIRAVQALGVWRADPAGEPLGYVKAGR